MNKMCFCQFFTIQTFEKGYFRSPKSALWTIIIFLIVCLRCVFTGDHRLNVYLAGCLFPDEKLVSLQNLLDQCWRNVKVKNCVKTNRKRYWLKENNSQSMYEITGSTFHSCQASYLKNQIFGLNMEYKKNSWNYSLQPVEVSDSF